ncbi:autotransporter outer membrane beta-barrel domain-containing protein [Brucella rhizosphaerae]|uniref:Outer membrane autotransporter barrel domain protein n=1 Tax=Brucella rhizosphaerae TaxID=571254 RepID=A0A256FTZ8_9HYPH|nr:autotransporter outer membrane beta-barrel domain-containing protein [Brucella rhizosphaerae]OYR18303.1 outer membrane autotransporter barrel domain protein [Brucella rhizosphaerae]
MGASSVDPSSTRAVSGGNGDDGASGILSQNQNAGGGGGGGGGGTGVLSSDTSLENNTTINGGSGGSGGTSITATATADTSGGSAGDGGDGGTGVYYDNATAVQNAGTIRGGAGGAGNVAAVGQDVRFPAVVATRDGGTGGVGGMGGTAAIFNDGVSVRNAGSGVIGGGTGGAGGAAGRGGNSDGFLGNTPSNGGDGAAGGNGRDGGNGVLVSGGGTLDNNGSISGGAGGQGGNGGNGGYGMSSAGSGGDGGNGGNGGVAVTFSTTATIFNTGQLSGGQGAAGADGGGSGSTQGVNARFSGQGGAGGNGGIALQLSGANNSVSNTGGTIAGGDGNDGGTGGDASYERRYANHGSTGNSGDGGRGADAIVLGDTSTVLNINGTMRGGNGGNGGKKPSAAAGNPPPGDGGLGGNGITASQGGTVTNKGTITGGRGGTGGLKSDGTASTWAAGGYGILLSGGGGKVINAGTISGGLYGNGTDRTYAVSFTGGNSTLELHSGSVITGDVVAQGTGNTFILGGDDDDTFAGSVSATTTGTEQYRGFQTNAKDGASTWTLIGDYNGWTIKQGVLQIGNGGTTGSVSGDVITGIDATTKGTLAFNRSDSVVFDHLISGTGFVEQKGPVDSIVTLTADNTYTGGTIISSGTLQLGNGGTTGSIEGDVANNGTLVFNRSDGLTFSGLISGTGALTQTGPGATILTGDSTYTGGTIISSGTLQLGNGGTTGSIMGDVTNNGTLAFNRSDGVMFSGLISGTGFLSQTGSGTTILTADNTYTGGTSVSTGTLQLGDGHVSGSIKGGASIATGAALAFNHSDAVDFDGSLSGAGLLNQMGSGALSLNGDSSVFTGRTSVSTGTLLVNGALGGTVEVASGASLGGTGTVKGNATLDAGGANLVGREGQTLTFDHDLTLAAGNNVNVVLGAPTTNGLFNVHGNLTLDGTLNVTDMGGFGPGLYRIFDYDGGLTDNGFLLGTVPGGDTSQMTVQTAVQHQVNLVNTMGVTLNFWDGDDPAKHRNNNIDGGNGIWNVANDDWTGSDGQVNGSWANGQFAVFTGSAGTVTVDNGGGTVSASGMQFATDGYRLDGDALTLAGDATPIIRVDKNATATIAAELQGTQGLNKNDFGTLVLTGLNTYTGGTTVNEGILQLGDGGASGSITGDVVLARTAYDYGTLAFNRSDAVNFDGVISGEGEVLQRGAGTTTFSGNNSFSGGLTVSSGTAQAGIADNAFGSGRLIVNAGATADLNNFNTTVRGLLDGKDGGGTVSLGSGTLTLNQDFDSIFSGTWSGTGGLTKNSSGSLTLAGTSSYSGATQLNGGTLRQGAKGAFSGASAYSVSAGSSLLLNGFDTAMVSLSNNGLTDFGGNGGTVLNVAGNYTGNGGMLVLNTVLGDDSSKTDLLKVGGDTSGTSTVKVNNRGGMGAKTNEGIKIISVGGQSNGTFNLAGDYTTKDGQQAVVAGAYAYSLHEGGVSSPADGDWYLRSELKDGTGPIINPGVPLYQGAVVAMQTLNKLPTLQQRVGNRYWDGAANPVIEQGADAIGTPLVSSEEAGTAIDQRGIWGRIEGAHSRLEPNGSGMKQDINTYLMQAGVDGQFYEGESGKLIGGITGQYGNAHSDISSRQSDGDVETQGWGLGGTLTWYGDHGFYVDTQAQASWYDNDFNSTTANKSLANGRKGFGYALSAEWRQSDRPHRDLGRLPQCMAGCQWPAYPHKRLWHCQSVSGVPGRHECEGCGDHVRDR